jgi:hypothetical protein
MPGYRCLNNQAGYCKDPSRAGGSTADCSDIGHPGVHVLQVDGLTGCTLNPRNCGFFLSWNEE